MFVLKGCCAEIVATGAVLPNVDMCVRWRKGTSWNSHHKNGSFIFPIHHVMFCCKWILGSGSQGPHPKINKLSCG
jgi:hypothetical protein